MKCDRLTLKLPEKIEKADGTACAEKIAHCTVRLDEYRKFLKHTEGNAM